MNGCFGFFIVLVWPAGKCNHINDKSTLTTRLANRHIAILLRHEDCTYMQDEQFISECETALVNQQFMVVMCNGLSAVLNRYRLGSGGKGKCIEFEGDLLTPNEFQARCGKASSKDWKRSIRYRGRPLSRLIDGKILNCHAISCICAACSDDASAQSPIRYFKKWNRKRKTQGFLQNTNNSSNEIATKFSPSTNLQISPFDYRRERSLTAEYDDRFNRELRRTSSLTRQPCPVRTRMVVADDYNKPGCSRKKSDDNLDKTIEISNPSIGEAKKNNKVLTADMGTDRSDPPHGVVLNQCGIGIPSINPLSNLHNEIVNDIVNEQKCWWHLETVAESLIRETVSLQAIVSQTKEASMSSKANMLIQLRSILSSTAERNASTYSSSQSECLSDEHLEQTYHNHETPCFSSATKHLTPTFELEKLSTSNQLFHTDGIVKYSSNMPHCSNTNANENQADHTQPSIPKSNPHDSNVWSSIDKYLATPKINSTLVAPVSSTSLSVSSHLSASKMSQMFATLPSSFQTCYTSLPPHPMLHAVRSHIHPLAIASHHVEPPTAIAFKLDSSLCTHSTEKSQRTSPTTPVATSDLVEYPPPIAMPAAIRHPDKIVQLPRPNSGSHSAFTDFHFNQVETLVADRLTTIPNTLQINKSITSISNECLLVGDFNNQTTPLNYDIPPQTRNAERISARSGDPTNHSTNCNFSCDDPTVKSSQRGDDSALLFKRCARSSSEPISIPAKRKCAVKSGKTVLQLGHDKRISGKRSIYFMRQSPTQCEVRSKSSDRLTHVCNNDGQGATTESAKNRYRHLRLLQLSNMPRKRTGADDETGRRGHKEKTLSTFDAHIRKIRRVKLVSDNDIGHDN